MKVFFGLECLFFKRPQSEHPFLTSKIQKEDIW